MKDSVLLQSASGNDLSIEVESITSIWQDDKPELCVVEYSSGERYTVRCDFDDLVSVVFKGFYDLRPAPQGEIAAMPSGPILVNKK